MKRFVLALAAIFALAVLTLLAQNPAPASNITGLAGHARGGPGAACYASSHRAPCFADSNSGWKGELLSIDQAPIPAPLTSISLNGTEFNFAVDAYRVKFHGTLSADGNSIKGTFNQAGTCRSISTAPHLPQNGRSIHRRIKSSSSPWIRT